MKAIGGLSQCSSKSIAKTASLAFGLAFLVSVSGARAQTAAASGTAVSQAVVRPASVGARAQDGLRNGRSRIERPYYIEFRARSAQSYGHTFSVYGRLNERGGIATKTVAGLHPFTESEVPWVVGHFVLVPSETGASDGDNEDQYVTARFRVVLSRDEYEKVTTYISQLKKQSPVWHAVLNNCNKFVGSIAQFMGLATPDSTMLMPATYVDALRDLNMSRTRTASLVGVPVRVEDASALRAKALKALERSDKQSAKGAVSAAPAADTLSRSVNSDIRRRLN